MRASLAGGSVCVAFLAATVGVLADEPMRYAQADNPCAIYGSGFVSASGGTAGCARIGGRLRVDAAAERQSMARSAGGPPALAPAPAPMEGPMRAHIRLNNGFGRR